MKALLSIVCISLPLFSLLGCVHSNDTIQKKLEELMEKPVHIPYKHMSCWINDTIQDNRPWEQAELKLIVYTDTLNCSECTLRKMYLWDDFVKLEKQYNGRFEIVFIMQTRQNATQSLVSALHFTELHHPIYVDSTNVFMTTNPHIPSENWYHIFLLDENGQVVLIGSPLFNSEIERQLLNIVEEKLGKKQKVSYNIDS